MSEDEEATLLMPSPRTPASDSEPGERCLTPAVGVSSMGDTYFEATQTGGLKSPGSSVVIGQDSLIESVAAKPVMSEVLQKVPLTPLTTTAPLEGRADLVRPHLERILENRRILWPLALLAGAIVGLIIALALRGTNPAPVTSTDSLRATDPVDATGPDVEKTKLPNEGPPPPSAPNTLDPVSTVEVAAMGHIKEEEVRTLQKSALLAELGGDCQESARIYGELERGDQSAARERWQIFSRAVRLRCAHVEVKANRPGDGQ